MSVANTHPQYDEYQAQWIKTRTVVAGEDAVKAAGVAFLPMLDDQSSDEYNAYKDRAYLYGASDRTVKGLSGAVLRKDPMVVFSDEDLLKSITSDLQPFGNLVKDTMDELLTPGRCGVLVDIKGENTEEKPYTSFYYAENITNWRTDEVDGCFKLTQVVLKEKIYVQGDDEFTYDAVIQYRVLSLTNIEIIRDGDKKEVITNDVNHYQVDIYQKTEEKTSTKDDGWVIVETMIPTNKGKRLDYIPFVIINSEGTSTQITKSPILDLVNINISHYRSSADLEHGRHYTALPTAWVAGFDPKTTKLKIGSTTAWVAESPDAHAEFLEFSGSGLGAISDGMKDKEALMSVLGARLLEDQKRDVEAAETHKLRQAGENSVLANIARSAEEGLTQVLQWCEDWLVGGKTDASVELNKDYTTTTMSAQDLTGFMMVMQQGGMSYDTFFYNMKKGELVPDGRTMEDELELIENTTLMGSTAEPLDLGDGNEGGEEEEEGQTQT